MNPADESCGKNLQSQGLDTVFWTISHNAIDSLFFCLNFGNLGQELEKTYQIDTADNYCY